MTLKFTTEGEDNKTLAFLDTLLLVIQPDGSIRAKIYRKTLWPIFELSFQPPSWSQTWRHLHFIPSSFTLVMDNLDRQAEKSHINSPLPRLVTPDGLLKQQLTKPSSVESKPASKGLVAIPYMKGFQKLSIELIAPKILTSLPKPKLSTSGISTQGTLIPPFLSMLSMNRSG